MAKYKPTEKLMKSIKELQGTYDAKLQNVKIDTQKEWIIEFKDVFGEDWQEKIFKISATLAKVLRYPSNRMVHKMRGVDIREAIENFNTGANNLGYVNFNSLHICVYIIELSTNRIEFENYLDFLIAILDPLSDYVNEQEKLINEKINLIIEENKKEYEAKVKELQEGDQGQFAKQNNLKLA
jgi:ubiquitin-protein ligase